jgi:hypothetical protein
MWNIIRLGVSKERIERADQDKKKRMDACNCLPRRVRKLTGSRRDGELGTIRQEPFGAGYKEENRI